MYVCMCVCMYVRMYIDTPKVGKTREIAILAKNWKMTIFAKIHGFGTFVKKKCMLARPKLVRNRKDWGSGAPRQRASRAAAKNPPEMAQNAPTAGAPR